MWTDFSIDWTGVEFSLFEVIMNVNRLDRSGVFIIELQLWYYILTSIYRYYIVQE